METLEKIKKSKFAKSIILISGGTALAQIINILFSPVLTRIYTPEEFGVLTVYTSILALMTLIASLRYEWGIPIAPTTKKALNVLAASLLILTFVVSLITLSVYTFGDYILLSMSMNSIIEYKYFIPMGVFFVGLYNIFVQWAFREKDYKNLSKTKIIQSATQNFFKLLLGLFGMGSMGLIIGRIAGQSSGITAISKSLYTSRINLKGSINVRDILWALKRYKNFAIFSAPGQLLNSGGVQLPVFFLTTMYDSTVVGYYGLANTIVSLPMILIGMSVADVYYSELANIKDTNPLQIRRLTLQLLQKLSLIGLIPLVALILFGPFLFSVVFGENWITSGVYAQIIAPLVFARLIFTPFERIFAVFEKQKISLMLDATRLLLVMTIFTIAGTIGLDSYKTVQIYSIGMIIIYCSSFILSWRVIRNLGKKNENRL